MAYQVLGDKTVQNWIDNLGSNELFNDLSQNQKILYIDSIQQECAVISKINNLGYYENSDKNIFLNRARLIFTSKKQTMELTVVTDIPIYSASLDMVVKKQTMTFTGINSNYSAVFNMTAKKQTMSTTVHAVTDINAIDSWGESHCNYSGISVDTARPAVAQGITGDGRTLVSCKFYLKNVDTATGNCRAILYAHSGTWRTDSKPTGVALSTSEDVDVSTISYSIGLVQFVFLTPYTLVDGTHYELAFESNNVKKVYIGEDTASPPSPVGNDAFYTASWSANVNRALIFYAYGVNYADATLSFTVKKQTMAITVVTQSSVTLDMIIKKQTIVISGTYAQSLYDVLLNIISKKQLISMDVSAPIPVHDDHMTIDVKKTLVTITGTIT